MFKALHGHVPLPRLRRQALIWTWLSFCFPLLMQGVGLISLPDQTFWSIPVLMHSMSFLLLGAAFWFVSCRALAHMARRQTATMIDDYKVRASSSAAPRS